MLFSHVCSCLRRHKLSDSTHDVRALPPPQTQTIHDPPATTASSGVVGRRHGCLGQPLALLVQHRAVESRIWQ